MYADDMLLLALSAARCQEMLDFVRVRLGVRGLMLNATKTEAIVLHTASTHRPPPLMCNGVAIPWTDCVRYLGLWVDSSFTVREHVARVIQAIRFKERQLWASGILSGERVKTSVARDCAASHIFSHAEFVALVLPFEDGWQAVEDAQVRVARHLLHLPQCSNRDKTLATIGWLPITERLRWFRMKWWVRCRALAVGSMWRHMVEWMAQYWSGVSTATVAVGGYAAVVRRDLCRIHMQHLFDRPDGVAEFVRSFGRGGVAAALVNLKATWRAVADHQMLCRIGQRSDANAARRPSSVILHPAAVPAALQPWFSTPRPRLAFQTSHDTMWCRPGAYLRAQMLTDCYPVGRRMRRLQAIRQQVPVEDVDERWGWCPCCKSDAECTLEHLAVTCPSAELAEVRAHMMRRVRAVSAEFMVAGVNATHYGTSVVVGVLTPHMRPDERDEAAEQARVDGWLRIILGGRTCLPALTANQARSWGFHVPPTVAESQMIIAVDLSCRWDDDMWPRHRYQLTKVRFSTHVVTAEYLLYIDDVYKKALEAWLA